MGLISMDWNAEDLARLETALSERWIRFKQDNRTDRKNLSELWNFHIGSLGITCMRTKSRSGYEKKLTNKDFMDIINFRNWEVADALCVRNPDRIGQYLFVPRETAGKILMLGMP